MLTHSRRVATDQLAGIAAQVAFGSPAIVASLVLARLADLRLIHDLAIAFGLTATVFVAASFNLSQYLALWGLRDFSTDAFWANRAVSASAASVIAVILLRWYGVDPHLAVLASLMKFTDSFADLRFGLRLLTGSTHDAMRLLLRWSLARVGIFMVGTFAAAALGWTGERALLVGGVLQFVCLMPWRTAPRVRMDRSTIRSASELGRGAAHLAVAATASGLLVTTPRLIIPGLAPLGDLGYYGIVFVASTVIGMSFNVAWFRLASATRDSDPLGALRQFLLEGAVLTVLLLGGLWLSVPLVARLYGTDATSLGAVFVPVGAALVVLYFVMALANMLKTARYRLLESTAYLAAAASLVGFAELFHSLIAGILVASLVLAGFVVGGVQSVRRLVRS